MLRQTSEAIVLTRALLDEVIPFVEGLPEFNCSLTQHDGSPPTEQALNLDVFECGSHYCLLGWALKNPAFERFRYKSNLLGWTYNYERASHAIKTVLGIDHYSGFPLFSGQEVPLADRKAFLEAHYEELVGGR